MGFSRREADEYIERGYVKVNDIVVNLGARIAETDTVVVRGETLVAKTEFQYLALNKPAGYVCSRRSQGDLPTIYELLPPEYHHLKTVGRLDFNSSGLIILTNNGDFTYQSTHPKFAKTKVYNVRLDHDLEPLHQQMISDYGVELEDGPSKIMLERLSEDDRLDWKVIMSEGRNRQIRRTFNSLGYEVKKLHRTNFGNYSIGDIKPGKFEIVDMR